MLAGESNNHLHMYHEVIAATGGLLFIALGIARRRERKKLLTAGIGTESPLIWETFVASGLFLIVFALGLSAHELSL